MHTGQIRHTGAVDKDVKGYFLQTAQRLGSVSAPHDRGQRLRRLGAVSVCLHHKTVDIQWPVSYIRNSKITVLFMKVWMFTFC